MAAAKIHFTAEGVSQSVGMGDFLLLSPDGTHQIEIIYEGEPPHGDSYHRVVIDGTVFPGYAWGCNFAFSQTSNFAVFSWMSKLLERRTVVVDLEGRKYFPLPEYIYDFCIQWPSIVGVGKLASGKQFTFTGSEQWSAY
jgi:hypothetical protein